MTTINIHTKVFDPSIPLRNYRHEKFCQNLVNGVDVATSSKGMKYTAVSATQAYKESGYVAKGNAAESATSRLLRNVKVKSRIQYLREQQSQMLAELGVATKMECCQILTSIIRAKYTDFLAMGEDGIYMFNIDEETLNTSALKKAKTKIRYDESGNVMAERQFDEIEVESKIPAIKQLSAMLGWKKTDDTEEKKVNVYKEFLDNLVVPPASRTPQAG